jgi:DNA-binding MarR family transcriptional regulator
VIVIEPVAARTRLKLDEFLPYRLSLASNVVSQVIAQSYEKLFALKMHEWRVIAVLAEGGELTQQELVRHTQMDKVTVSRAAQVLERRELLRRVKSSDDARSLRLSLTPTGKDLHRRVVPAALELEAKVLEGLSAREVAALKVVLRRLEGTATQLLDRG